MTKIETMDLTQEEWVATQKETANAHILDVRTPQEFEAGHIPGAQNLDIQQPNLFMDGLAKLAADQHYFVYCRSGARSARACQILAQSGLQNVYNLVGGILEWEGPTE